MIGAGTGWGIGRDVVEAYAFLAKHYTKESKLYIFGFSRGAYTSRILAGMIYSVGGIYNLNNFKETDRLKISEELYSAYKGDVFDLYSSNKGEGKKIWDVEYKANKIFEKWKKKLSNSTHPELHENVQIDVMGLWDTVEALGVIPSLEALNENVLKIKDHQNIVNPNRKYLDQICDIKNIYHTLSLDDNRANVFTPIIISSEYVVSKCNFTEESSIEKVEEVWFAGAYSDVGGGYNKER